MAESMDRRAIVTGTLAAGLAALSTTAQAAEPKEAQVKLIEVKEIELEERYLARFKKQPRLTAYPDMALAINSWLGDKKLRNYSGFWTGEMGSIDGDKTYQFCIIRHDP